METKLARITEIAKQDRKEKFTALAHYINVESLKAKHKELKPDKASGVDKVTKEEYGKNLDANVADVIDRMKRQAYKPQPARRTYIPKPGSTKQRPLGIPAYEDKLVQKVIASVLNAIYEVDFLNCSFGFRPNRGCHEALKVLGNILDTKKINYVVDADIKGFFEHVNHEWLMKFLEQRIADPNFLRVIARFLRAGIMEAGIKYDTPEGTPQGGVISPILANVYLHYALDLWFEGIYRKSCRGDAYLVRYADDFVCCFQHKDEAEAFLIALKERLAKFNLEVAEEKTKILEFGRHAEEEIKRRGGGKPGTFDFLGFTHYCGKNKYGKFRVKRRTSRKKYIASLQRTKDWFRHHLTLPAKELIARLKVKLLGHYRYYGITDNKRQISNYADRIKKQLFWWFNRRSQGKHFNWEKFNLFLAKFPLPRARCYVSMYDVDPELLRRGRVNSATKSRVR